MATPQSMKSTSWVVTKRSDDTTWEFSSWALCGTDLGSGKGDSREQADTMPSSFPPSWIILKCCFFLQTFWRIPEYWANTCAERPAIGKDPFASFLSFFLTLTPETVWAGVVLFSPQGQPQWLMPPKSHRADFYWVFLREAKRILHYTWDRKHSF